MQEHTVRGAAYYRCRYPQEYALANTISHPANVYVREDAVVPALDSWLATTLKPPRLTDTLDAMAATQTGPTGNDQAADRAHRTIKDCTTKIARYRAALEAGADPALVTDWIAQTQAERATAERQLRDTTDHTDRRTTRDEIAAMVEALGDMLIILAEADPADKAEIRAAPTHRGGPRARPPGRHKRDDLVRSTQDVWRRVSEGGLEPPRP
nr:hypothetical protein [Frankia sp. Cr2]